MRIQQPVYIFHALRYWNCIERFCSRLCCNLRNATAPGCRPHARFGFILTQYTKVTAPGNSSIAGSSLQILMFYRGQYDTIKKSRLHKMKPAYTKSLKLKFGQVRQYKLAILSGSCSKLFQKPQIILAEQSQVFYLVFQHGDSFDTHTKGEASVFIRIDTTVL